MTEPQPAAFRIVLIEPEIAPNTGNVARLCAATKSELHLVEPLGFKIDDRQLKRAGMDYWSLVTWRTWPGWTSFRESLKSDDRLWFIEDGAPQRYIDARFEKGDVLVFGRETAGIPRPLLEASPGRWLGIPMPRREARSLNLANSVAIVLYEALRQTGF